MDKITYLKMNSFRNQLRRCNVPPNHRLACSLFFQQRCHPRAGHDSPRNKELAGLHVAKDNNTTRVHNSTKPTQLGLSGEQQASQANKVGFIRPSRSWERIILRWCTDTKTSLDSRTPTHTQHKEINPFSVIQSLRP